MPTDKRGSRRRRFSSAHRRKKSVHSTVSPRVTESRQIYQSGSNKLVNSVLRSSNSTISGSLTKANRRARNGDVPVLDAGIFSSWLRTMQTALKTNAVVRVPCGSCDACCRSSRFVHVIPSERRTLQHIPRQLLFPAPLLPPGTVVLGYDKKGRCPMLADDGCSIYQHRPMTCRSFDCRALAACDIGLDADNPIARQARRWRFQCPTDRDRQLLSAVRKASRFLHGHAADFPTNTLPRNEIQIAAVAIKVYNVFLNHNAVPPRPYPYTVKAVLTSLEDFDGHNSAV